MDYKEAVFWQRDEKLIQSDFLCRPQSINALGNVKGKRILDIGCGEGYVSRILALKGASVVGIDNSREMIGKAIEIEPKKLSEFVSELNCFSYWHQKYLCPEIYVHRDYSIYTCPLFEPHEALKIGNAKKDSLKDAIKNANKNKFLRLIAEKGTKGIYEMLKDKCPEIENIRVTNRHEACKILSEYFKE
ncbi:MAG: methyltransferase domain-containing protein [Candidatus Diapherotrites archaeon]|jgi:SAM-dependent methyltransferase|nr:methyltransferase domain-containing protein [Candidatus Diapherotrites archaeon]MBT4597052.1 methyltransferase domain-containing protein [Candidatus Diapherotrites archaeon]